MIDHPADRLRDVVVALGGTVEVEPGVTPANDYKRSGSRKSQCPVSGSNSRGGSWFGHTPYWQSLNMTGASTILTSRPPLNFIQSQ